MFFEIQPNDDLQTDTLIPHSCHIPNSIRNEPTVSRLGCHETSIFQSFKIIPEVIFEILTQDPIRKHPGSPMIGEINLNYIG